MPTPPTPPPTPIPTQTPTPIPTPTPTVKPMTPFCLSGAACAEKSPLMGQYDLEGYTASGAPYYKLVGYTWPYIYWDPDCAGSGSTASWILDIDSPDTSAAKDLDGDGKCSWFAHIDSSDSRGPPSGTNTWRLTCDGAWTENDLTIAPSFCPPTPMPTEIPTPAPTASPTPPTPSPTSTPT